MSTQFSLIITSILISLAAGIGIFSYLKTKPKKINYLLLLIILSLLPVVSIFRPGSYESSDLSAHVTFAISFFRALIDGSIVPRWAMDLNYTYGYPAFLFIYLLPYYLISLLHIIGIPFLLGTKLVLASSFIGSGITIYYFAKEELGELGGFIAALFYLYAPYHLVDLHFRVDIGEIVAFVFLPLVLLAVKKLYIKHSIKNGIFIAFSFAALILSHPAISLAGSLIIPLYVLYLLNNKPKEKIKTSFFALCSFAAGIVLTSFYWFPIFIEGKFTTVYLHGYRMIFPNIISFLVSPYYWGFLYQGHKGELVFPIGFVQLIILLSMPFVLKKKLFTAKLRFLLFSILAVFSIYFLLMQRFSEPLWYIIPLIKNFQFSYRLMGIIIFCISIIAGILLPKIKNRKILVVILTISVLTTILNWGNRKNVPTLNENYLQQHVAQSDINYAVMGQGVPVWADKGLIRPWILSFPKNHLQVISGTATIIEKQRKTTEHSYLVQAKTPVTLQENTWFFPGWVITENGKDISLKITTGEKPGLMQFSLPAGMHTVSVTFADTWDRDLGNKVSLITIICLIFYALWVFTSKKLLLYLRKQN